MAETPPSVILYDPEGRRKIYSDLKDIQERADPLDRFRPLAASCDLPSLGKINFARALLHEGKRLEKSIAADVHAIAALDDNFNRAFMAAADIRLMRHERRPAPPEAWAAAAVGRCRPKVLVVGLGAEGALPGGAGRRRHGPLSGV